VPATLGGRTLGRLAPPPFAPAPSSRDTLRGAGPGRCTPDPHPPAPSPAHSSAMHPSPDQILEAPPLSSPLRARPLASRLAPTRPRTLRPVLDRTLLPAISAVAEIHPCRRTLRPASPWKRPLKMHPCFSAPLKTHPLSHPSKCTLWQNAPFNFARPALQRRRPNRPSLRAYVPWPIRPLAPARSSALLSFTFARAFARRPFDGPITMPYTSRYNGPNLTPEESEVKSALHQYTTDRATTLDWVPLAALRRTYLQWRAENRARLRAGPGELPQALTVRQFGRAMGRVFPGIVCCARSYCGQQQRGYAGLLGPESVVTKLPPHDKYHRPAAAADRGNASDGRIGDLEGQGAKEKPTR
jgi:hypothetical protein